MMSTTHSASSTFRVKRVLTATLVAAGRWR